MLRLVDGDVLNMANESEVAGELAFNESRANTDNLVGFLVNDDDGVVCARCSPHGVELREPLDLAYVRCGCQDGEHGKVTPMIVRGCQWSNLAKKRRI